MTSTAPTRSSVDPGEVARFSALAEAWWDPHGAFAPLHRLNPVRLAFIRDQCLERFGRDGRSRAPFEGLRLVDIGCGGGLLCEPMTRLGFEATGIDASAENIAMARAHAARMELEIDYRHATAEALLASGEPAFDVVLNMEVVEHVADPAAFLRDCARLLAPGGLMIVGTLNRTLKALVLAKIGAEYLLRWVPPGTHDWRRFITPDELRGYLGDADLHVAGPFGIAFEPLSGKWTRSADAGVNYMMTLTRADAGVTRTPQSGTSDGRAGIRVRPRRHDGDLQTMKRSIWAGAMSALTMIAAGAVCAQAAPSDPPPSKAMRQACAADVKTFCGDVTPGQGRLMACMKAHADKLSAGCQAAATEARAARKAARQDGQTAQPAPQ